MRILAGASCTTTIAAQAVIKHFLFYSESECTTHITCHSKGKCRAISVVILHWPPHKENQNKTTTKTTCWSPWHFNLYMSSKVRQIAGKTKPPGSSSDERQTSDVHKLLHITHSPVLHKSCYRSLAGCSTYRLHVKSSTSSKCQLSRHDRHRRWRIMHGNALGSVVSKDLPWSKRRVAEWQTVADLY